MQVAPQFAGDGRVSVVESRLQGGARAVHCLGTGGLRSVRVIYESHASFFWLEVDSAVPGHYHDAVSQWHAQHGNHGKDVSTDDVHAVGISGADIAVVDAKVQRQSGDAGEHCTRQQQQTMLHEQQAGPEVGLKRIQMLLGKRFIRSGSLGAYLQTKKHYRQT